MTVIITNVVDITEKEVEVFTNKKPLAFARGFSIFEI
jgi:hypothetical protein